MILVDKAKTFAIAAHAAVNHRRKYTNKPYIVHPARVAKLVKEHGGGPEMVAAAWLHDVVEDTGVDLETIYAHFGSEVGSLVRWLTNPEKVEGENRATRKAKIVEKYKDAPEEAHTIKLADMLDNLPEILSTDPSFAKVYKPECEKLAAVLTKGHPDLIRKLNEHF